MRFVTLLIAVLLLTGNAFAAGQLRIGTLAGVEPDALRFTHEVVWKGTLAEGAALMIEEVQAECWCQPCAAPFPADGGVCECPRCGAISRELRQGRELQLASLELL